MHRDRKPRLREFFFDPTAPFAEAASSLADAVAMLERIAQEEVDLEAGVDPLAAAHMTLALAALQQARAQFTLADLHHTRALAASGR